MEAESWISWREVTVPLTVAILVILGSVSVVIYKRRIQRARVRPNTVPRPKPVSVNYHFTRQCNYQCGFCFHTAKTSFVLPIDEAKRGLKLLKDAGKDQVITCIPMMDKIFLLLWLLIKKVWKKSILVEENLSFIRKGHMLGSLYAIAKKTFTCLAYLL